MRHVIQLAALVLSAALNAAGGSANTLSAPDTVYADESGDFSYRFTCIISPDSTVIAGIGWNNVSNVSGAWHGDCFCFPNCYVGPGEELHFDVEGSLVEPLIPGTVDNWVAFCGDSDVRAGTIVMPKGPLPALPATWGRIKALYR
jgi:hypothetical protein